jgi:ribonuclease HI
MHTGIRASQPAPIDPTMPWDFFDGASQNLLCGGGGGGGGAVLHISDSHFIKIKMGLGKGTNNYAELMALLLLLKTTIEQGLHSIQLFGDSMNVINWVQKTQSCHNIFLQPILEEISTLLASFDSFTIRHVYRNRTQ